MPATAISSIFQIVRGVPKVPLDTATVQPDPDSIDLLEGSGLSTDSYDMQFPNLKNGALWSESPTADGRTLMSAANGNITETVRLQLNSATLIEMAAVLGKFGQFRRYINAFWASRDQNDSEPVYLKHQIIGEPGPRFALLYNIEVNVETPLNPNEPHRLLTLSLEREPYWRGLAPGDNPKRWTIEHIMVGQKWDTSKASLYQNTDHAGYGLIDNCQEWLTASSFQSRNFIDIPASSIPGDAPPLLCVGVTAEGSVSGKHLIGVSTNRTSITDRSGASLLLYNSIPMSSGTIASGTAAFTTDNNNGVAHVPTSPLKRTVVVTPAGATEVIVLTWNTGNLPHTSILVLKGKYAVFLRASQIGGTAGVCSARITMGNSGGNIFDSGLQRIGDDATAPVELNYMGTMELPNNGCGHVSIDGRGYTAETDIAVMTVSTLRASGTGTIRLVDIVLFPLGNYIYINHDVSAGGSWFDFYDDTGYLSHGHTEPIIAGVLSNTDGSISTEASGRLQLTPGVNNRLYFMEYRNNAGVRPNIDMAVRANIVPRWTGFRDV